jgi:uncharacterized membrane protein YkvA (DUF1232 family)
MGARVISSLARPGLLRTLFSHARLALRLMREPRVPLWLKAVPLLGVGYVLWPLDIIPDFLPLAGEVDDLAIVLMALAAFVKLCPQFAVEFHRTALAERRRYTPVPASETILDAEWRVSE